jgi:hypothetical protein
MPDGASGLDVHGALAGASSVLPNVIARMNGNKRDMKASG